MHAQFQSEYLKVRDHLKDLDTKGRIISGIMSGLKDIGYEHVYWINLAENRQQQAAIRIINFRIT